MIDKIRDYQNALYLYEIAKENKERAEKELIELLPKPEQKGNVYYILDYSNIGYEISVMYSLEFVMEAKITDIKERK